MRVLGGWVKKVRGLAKEKNPRRYRQQYCDYQTERGIGEVEEGKRGKDGTGTRLHLG